MRINHPSEEQIRARAFEIYVERGGGPGHELDDWLQAEFELAHLPFHVAHLQPLRARRKEVKLSLEEQGCDSRNSAGQ